ncbi:MAG: hypothetical protein DHS20C20_16910 [Ardenticatenaceae bacterium]|nr:MAG: hypothetical protein DHS20C20_16910 [Ardenticatenaceae bacterium]
MSIQFGRTAHLFDTQFAPVAALIGYYQTQNVLEPLQSVTEKDENKLDQVVLSMLTGCKTISEVNTKLRPERKLAQVKRIDGIADQSTLSRGLDDLSQMNLTHLEATIHQISQRCSRTRRHDWRGFLELDFDLSGLPCGKQAEKSKKGHFSGKKTSLDAN